jgi:hypothetical protein
MMREGEKGGRFLSVVLHMVWLIYIYLCHGRRGPGREHLDTAKVHHLHGILQEDV